MISAISERRSIRRYKDVPVSAQIVEEVLRAGLLAPSSKNRQPWKFIVVSGEAKPGALEAMRLGLLRERDECALLPNSRGYLSGAEATLKIIEKAPVVIFIINTLSINLFEPLTPEERVFEICNAQSIGAAIENMTLAATDLGLGSLWICDTFFAQEELNKWLGTDGELAAAMTLGYADENPAPRPRKDLLSAVEWRC